MKAEKPNICGADVGVAGFVCNGPEGHDGEHAWKGNGWEPNFYSRFMEEVEGITIMADDPAVQIVGRFQRAAMRAQLVVNGELPPFHERVLNGTDMGGY